MLSFNYLGKSYLHFYRLGNWWSKRGRTSPWTRMSTVPQPYHSFKSSLLLSASLHGRGWKLNAILPTRFNSSGSGCDFRSPQSDVVFYWLENWVHSMGWEVGTKLPFFWCRSWQKHESSGASRCTFPTLVASWLWWGQQAPWDPDVQCGFGCHS